LGYFLSTTGCLLSCLQKPELYRLKRLSNEYISNCSTELTGVDIYPAFLIFSFSSYIEIRAAVYYVSTCLHGINILFYKIQNKDKISIELKATLWVSIFVKIVDSVFGSYELYMGEVLFPDTFTIYYVS